MALKDDVNNLSKADRGLTNAAMIAARGSLTRSSNPDWQIALQAELREPPELHVAAQRQLLANDENDEA